MQISRNLESTYALSKNSWQLISDRDLTFLINSRSVCENLANFRQLSHQIFYYWRQQCLLGMAQGPCLHFSCWNDYWIMTIDFLRWSLKKSPDIRTLNLYCHGNWISDLSKLRTLKLLTHFHFSHFAECRGIGGEVAVT